MLGHAQHVGGTYQVNGLHLAGHAVGKVDGSLVEHHHEVLGAIRNRHCQLLLIGAQRVDAGIDVVAESRSSLTETILATPLVGHSAGERSGRIAPAVGACQLAIEHRAVVLRRIHQGCEVVALEIHRHCLLHVKVRVEVLILVTCGEGEACHEQQSHKLCLLHIFRV